MDPNDATSERMENVEVQLVENEVDGIKLPFKVTNSSSTRKIGILASNMEELEMKCREKFKTDHETISFVLEDDGTEVEWEYLQHMMADSVVMILQQGQSWEPLPLTSSSSYQNSDEKVMKLVQELRQSKKRKLDAKEPKKGKDPTRLMTVQVGWQNYSYKENRYKLVKATRERPDSGPTQLKLRINSTFEQIESTLRNHYFPGKRSPIGHEKKYQFCVGSYNGDTIDPLLTFGEFVSSKESKPRIYLLSKTNFMTILTDSSSDSDFELPPTIPFKKRHPSSRNTETVASTSIDFSDSLSTASIGEILQESPKTSTQASEATQYVNEGIPSSLSTAGLGEVLQSLPSGSLGQVQLGIPNTFAQTSQFVNAGTPSVSYNVDSITCCICMERPRDAFLIPCGHTYCMVCAVAQDSQVPIRRCSLCRRNILSVGQIRA